MKTAYAHAIANGYRFYSYGDASLLFRCQVPDRYLTGIKRNKWAKPHAIDGMTGCGDGG